MGGSGLLKVQHLIPVKLTHAQQQQMDPGNNVQQGRVSYIEFYVMPEEEGDTDAQGQVELIDPFSWKPDDASIIWNLFAVYN